MIEDLLKLILAIWVVSFLRCNQMFVTDGKILINWLINYCILDIENLRLRNNEDSELEIKQEMSSDGSKNMQIRKLNNT